MKNKKSLLQFFHHNINLIKTHSHNKAPMKLVYKNIIINTIVAIIVLFIGEYSLYRFLKYKIEKETIEHLYLESHLIKQDISKGTDVEYFNHNIGDIITVKPIKKIEYTKPELKDIEVEEKWEEESFSSKQILFDVTQNKQAYRISIIKTVDEDEGLAESLSIVLIISALIMLVILIITNLVVFSRLFAPLSKLIKAIKEFSASSQHKIVPPLTNTSDFMILGDEISNMSEKIINDFNTIKEFTDNITHEIQTPLAVINSKIERSLQDKNLTEDQAIHLNDALKAVNKLFNINKGLILISKLDNKQYSNLSDVNVGDFIHERISYFGDFISVKHITINESYSNELIVQMDHSLSEILLDNILKNSISHNITNGIINIELKNKSLIISNTGVQGDLNNDIFNRFYTD